MNVKKLGFLAVCMLFSLNVQAQWLGLKTNALAWASTSPNLGVEFAFGEKSRSGFFNRLTLEVDGMYNPFTWSDGRSTEIWAVQAEFREYFDYKFTGHFMGLYGEYADYNYGLWKYRYVGTLWGGGLSYGYVWQLCPRWNVEGNIGLGVTRILIDDKYDRKDDRIDYGPETNTKFGVSRIGINFTYFLK